MWSLCERNTTWEHSKIWSSYTDEAEWDSLIRKGNGLNNDITFLPSGRWSPGGWAGVIVLTGTSLRRCGPGFTLYSALLLTSLQGTGYILQSNWLCTHTTPCHWLLYVSLFVPEWNLGGIEPHDGFRQNVVWAPKLILPPCPMGLFAIEQEVIMKSHVSTSS